MIGGNESGQDLDRDEGHLVKISKKKDDDPNKDTRTATDLHEMDGGEGECRSERRRKRRHRS